ncbi:DUF4365 domain-containing protein [Streptomyces goshikiensis]|uniref:DUF4365 domain-containing protein n=1 Tax=Streptomyces goshikiensis TaxID=1942 RepID=UPI0036DAE1D3
MTHRPVQHRIASLAVAAVRQQWNLQGHAVDEIREDYGEDLLVQICFDGVMDPARIWVQVKGTAQDCSSGLPSVRIQAHQVLRWSRTADLVVVVLWNVIEERGWFVLPQGNFDPIELRENPSRMLTLSFSRDRPFDCGSVTSLAWGARIEHTNRAVVYSGVLLDEDLFGGGPAAGSRHRSTWIALLFDFSVAVGIIQPDGHFSQGFADAIRDYLLEADLEDLETATRQAILVAIVSSVSRNCAQSGLPEALVVDLCCFLHTLFFDEARMQLMAQVRIAPRD